MRDLLAGLRIRPALPAGGVTFEVVCRSGGGRRGYRHEVTVADDWALTTPHDLEVERIGVALGGEASCVELADRALPAARALIEHVLRLEPAGIVREASDAWRVGVPAPGCRCEGRTWPTAQDAAAHLRDLLHWARRFDVTRTTVDRLVDHLLGGVRLADARCPVPHRAAYGHLYDPDGLDALWDAGVHPARVPGLVARLSPGGDPLPSHLVLTHLYLGDAAGWLESFAPHGAVVLAWAARTRGRRDERRPDERLALVAAGLPLPAIADLFAGDAYDLGDVRAYADATGVAPAVAARTLGAWQAAAITPTVAQLVELERSGPLLTHVPPLDAVLRVRTHAAHHDWRPSRVEAALAVARAGNVPDAVALLRTQHPSTPLKESA